MQLTLTEELSNSQTHLHSVEPRIQIAQACVRDVHVAGFQTERMISPQKVETESRAGSEIHARSKVGHIMVGEQRPATQFEIRNHATPCGEVPFQIHRVDTGAE